MSENRFSAASEAAKIRSVATRVARRNDNALFERLVRIAQYLDSDAAEMGSPAGDAQPMPLDLSQSGGAPTPQQGAPPIESFVNQSNSQKGQEHTATISWITFDDITEVQLMTDFIEYINSKGWKPVKFAWSARDTKG